MAARSSLEFRSNIYPVSEVKDFALDRDFRDSISDPFALSVLWDHDGTNGRLLNDLQRQQVKRADPCIVGGEGEKPWGTKVIDGERVLVCLCARRDCVLYEECMKCHPSRVRNSAASGAPHTFPEEGAARRPVLARKRLGIEARVSSPVVAESHLDAPEWTDEEDALLKKMFARHPREVLYVFFPYREAADIEDRIKRVCFSFARHEAKTATFDDESSRASAVAEERRQEPIVQVDKGLVERKQRLKDLRSRPWTRDEDVILLRNYPRYGTMVVLWDQQLTGRQADAIEARAKVLAVARDPESRSQARHKPNAKRKPKPKSRPKGSASTEKSGANRRKAGDNDSLRPWNPGEIQALRACYQRLISMPAILATQIPGRTIAEIKAKARELQL